MCGVAGIFSYGASVGPVDAAELRTIRDHMWRRGPDGSGEWFSENGRVGFGHRRLAIIDLSEKANQPMVSSDGRFVITYNGEIYNYVALRKMLEQKGVRLRTHSDTEVLLQMYIAHGAGMLDELRGMFAFSIWDDRENIMFLARDALGIKPLYYSDHDQCVRFASQVKALETSRLVGTEVSPAGVAGFMLLGSVPEPFTINRHIRALPAGCYLTVTSNGCSKPQRYFSIGKEWSKPRSSGRGREVSIIRKALVESIQHHRVSDVPVGIFLSAGIDSNVLLALAAEAEVDSSLRSYSQDSQENTKAITLGFDEYRNTSQDETPLAGAMAELYGCSHFVKSLAREEFEDDLDSILTDMDQPSIDGLNTWYVAKAANEASTKVAISGIGADEIFGGYPSFYKLPRWVSWCKWCNGFPQFGSAVRSVLSGYGVFRSGGKMKGIGMLEYGGTYAGAYLLNRGIFMPWELPGLLGGDYTRDALEELDLLSLISEEVDQCDGDGFSKVAVMESSCYMRNQLLRDADWAGMAHSVEIRVPFVDTVFLRNSIQAAGSGSKKKLAATVSGLAEEVTSRPKTGFTLPMKDWMKVETGEPQHWSRAWVQNIFEKSIA
jgi:asparagine synthase (glutamine-hydrolysing)